ncbi:Retrovirus-related Pol polyprotein from transposon TNT 1-94 [Vitis vinifera]|uniref:Retrovirus-related Pol polyprotein from transposon TNT 1-94 n=1 Tax=Vitis vinifera TaxID=29760 RepID=A0A438IAQ5_VITVI|nr:Retrovirus-related Pol polyprotein from transposon TNT 1-94 [Vitis vinifera]
MTTKNQIFTSVLSGSPLITSEKLVGSENYLSWSASVELWFMGQGYEDHLVTQEADIPEVDRVQWRKIDAQPKDYTRMISSVSIRWLLLLSISANRTWIYLLILLDKFFMVLTLIGLRPDLEPIRDQILGSSSVPSLDDVFARLLRLSSTQTLPSDSASDSSVLVSQTTSRGGRSGTRGRGQRPHCTYCNKLGHTRDRCYQLHGRPPRTAHMAQSSDSPLPQLPSSSASQTSQASIASVAQPGNVSACLTHTSSLGSWILDSGASDHLSGNKDLFSSITTTSDLPTVTLANGSQTVAKGPEYGFAFPLMLLSSFTIVWATLVSPSSRRWFLVFPTLSSLPCESCQLGKHTRVSFPKRLNNRAKSPFELVHTDVWGPCRTASTLGFQYFVTFIDDYSRSQFTSFMSHHGILHQSSCAHTPQQNGVAERKNRHLVETTRTLLLHSHVPFRFWGDAVLTACYLINRMPSSVLHDQIPHSLLFPDQPLYFLPPRVFGCTCFVHILTPGQDKLSAKAMKCSSWDIPDFRRVIVVIPLRLIGTLSPLMSPSLRTHHSFPPLLSLFPFLKSCPFPLSPHLTLCPLDHFRFIIVARVSLLLSLFPEAPADSLPIPSASPAPALPSPNDLPIAVRKGTRSTRNPHPIYNFLNYHRLSSPYSAFVSAISSVSLPKSTHEALSHPGWRQAMVDEMAALHSNGTWDLVVLPPGKSTVGCRWVYAVKVGPDGQVDRLKARLFAKGYTQVYGSDYGDTFSPVAKIASVRLLLSMAAMCSWPLYQLDIKNVFLHGDLAEEVYMEQPPGFVAQGSLCIYLVVYVDDIVITGSDQDGIQKLKQHLFTHFQTKDLGKLKYFLGIEIAQSSSDVVLSQRKYALDILEETGMLDCKPVDTPMDPNVKLVPGQGEPLGDPGRYRRLVGKLNYLTITRPDISFPAKVYCTRNRGHTQVVGYTDADWAGSPTDRRSTSGYCVFIGGNLISWKSKKQDVVARSSAEAEYRAMALATCELIWLRHLLQELRFGKDEQMKLICDNQAALHIASNPVFHERTKHIEPLEENSTANAPADAPTSVQPYKQKVRFVMLARHATCNKKLNGRADSKEYHPLAMEEGEGWHFNGEAKAVTPSSMAFP